MTDAYTLTLCQPDIELIFDDDNAVDPARIARNVAHLAALIERAYAATGGRIFVLPQGTMQGCVMRTVEQWLRGALTLPGPQTDALGEVARRTGSYICGSAFEVHAAFAGRYWNSAFIIDPDGALALVYRKHYAMTSKTRPADVYDAYVGAFGRDALFPVLDTPLGRLGCAVAGDVNWPEVTRCLAMKGAEVILNPTSSGPQFDHFNRPGGGVVRAARAFENVAYLAMANMGRCRGDAGEIGVVRQPSQVFDFGGGQIASVEPGPGRTGDATIDLAALRAMRASPSANFLAELQPFIHAPEYAAARFWPANGWADRPIVDKDEVFAMETSVWRQAMADGRASAD